MSALLNTVEAAQRLRLNPQTLNRWRRKGTGPAYIRIGKKVMYPDEQIQVWLQDHRETLGVSIHLPPLKKGGRGGFRTRNRTQIPPNPPLLKGGD